MMKNRIAEIKKSVPWLGEALLCVCTLVLCGWLLYGGVSGEELEWKPLLFGSLGILVAGGYSVVVLRDICHWVWEMRRDLSPEVQVLALTANQLRSRMQQLEQALAPLEDCSVGIRVTEKQAIWDDTVTLDAHLLKQNWCAAVSLPGGGVLLPSQLRRIGAVATVKPPVRWKNNELISCIICCDKGQLSIYPGSCAAVLRRELIPGILSADDAEFSAWLSEYVQEISGQPEEGDV